MSRLAPPPQYSSEFCDREYNSRATITNFEEIFALWRAKAKGARAGAARARIDVPYGPSSAERLDLFLAESNHAPLLLFIHGGYWRALDKSDFSWVAEPFNRAGVSVAVVNYGLAPKISLEEIVRQMVRASAWLWRRSKDYGFDRNRMVAAGHSAGGHLVAMLLAARWPIWEADLPEKLFRGAVAVSGVFDLEPLRHASFLNCDLKLTPERVAALSPLYMTPATDAALLTAVGELESSEFRRQTAELGVAWKNVLIKELLLVGDHHLNSSPRIADPDGPLFQATLGLLHG
jgi:arylformamidase